MMLTRAVLSDLVRRALPGSCETYQIHCACCTCGSRAVPEILGKGSIGYCVCHRTYCILVYPILAVCAWVVATVLQTIHCQWLQQSSGFPLCRFHLVRVSAQFVRQRHKLHGVGYGAAGTTRERVRGNLYSSSKALHISLTATHADVVLLV